MSGDDAHVVRDDQHGGVELVAGETQQVEDFGLHGHVEGSGGLVGEDQPGVEHQRHRDDDALLLAAGELVGIVVDAGLGLGDADLLEDVDGLRPALLLVFHAVGTQALLDLPADGVHRVEHRVGSWNTMAASEPRMRRRSSPDRLSTSRRSESARFDK